MRPIVSHAVKIIFIQVVGVIFYCHSTHAQESILRSDSVKSHLYSDTNRMETQTIFSKILADSLVSSQITYSEKVQSKKTKQASPTHPKTQEELESYHAKRAAIWGLLPGGGQIYNKRWWKVPIAWAMIGAGGYFIYNSASNMRIYNQALDMRNHGEIDRFNNILTEQQIIAYRNHYRRNLQLSAFGTVGLWTLTILDAVVDAHLKTYDISDNLSMKIKPKVLRVYNNSVPSLAITLYL